MLFLGGVNWTSTFLRNFTMKAFIFDLDGVICFTDEYHYLAWKALADKEGIYFDREINNLLRGVSRMQSLEIILRNAKKSYSESEKKDMAEYKNNIYRSYLMKMTDKDLPIEVFETLKKLKRLNYKIAIGSSSKNAKTILSNIGIIGMFDAISDGENISKSKPDPEVFLKAAEMLKLAPSECYVVEDAYSGIDAAKAGGFTSIGIGDASNYDKTDIKIAKFSDILKLIE